MIESLGAAWAEADDAIISLNAALMQDGLVIDVAPGAKLADPLHIVYASVAPEPVARISRSLVRVGAGATFQFDGLSLGRGGRTGQTNNVLILDVGDGADVAHTLSLTGTEPGSLRLETFLVKIGAKAKFDSFALITGAGLVRRQIYKLFAGADAKASLRGVCLLRGREHADTDFSSSAIRRRVARDGKTSATSSTTRRQASSRARSSLIASPRRRTGGCSQRRWC